MVTVAPASNWCKMRGFPSGVVERRNGDGTAAPRCQGPDDKLLLAAGPVDGSGTLGRLYVDLSGKVY